MFFRPTPALQIGKGFERLFETIDDLSVDVPAARVLAAKFVVRAVVDEVLPPGFLTDPVVASLAGDIADQAKASRDGNNCTVACAMGGGTFKQRAVPS